MPTLGKATPTQANSTKSNEKKSHKIARPTSIALYAKTSTTMKSRRFYYINAITKLLLESAVSVLTVENIAASIGVTKKTLYNYFESKQQLMECIMDTYLRHKIEEIRAELAKGQNPINLLVNLGTYVGVIYSDCLRIMSPKGDFTSRSSMHDIFVIHKNNLLDITQITFKKGISHKIFESDIDEKLASMLYLSGLQTLFRSDSHSYTMSLSQQQRNTMLFYMIKGSCTPKGLGLLRQTIDMKVVMA